MKKVIFIILSLILMSCTKSSDHKHSSSVDISSDSPHQTVAEYGTKSDENGTFKVSFTISQNISAFQLITRCNSEEIGVDNVVSPTGEVIFSASNYYSDYQTDGKQFQKNINTFNFPVSTTSSNLQEGTYTVTYKLRSGKGSKDASSALIVKSDSNKSSGVLTLNVIFAGSVASSTEIIKAIKKALDTYSIPTLNKAGIAVNVNYHLFPDIPSVLPDPTEGSSVYESVSSSLPAGINLFMGADVKNMKNDKGHSGLSASVPGPVLPTPKSAIAFSLNKAVGDDGEFNGRGNSNVDNDEKDEDEGDEIRLFSDSISHEICHYLGLRNSVEFQGNVVTWGDGLNSEKCVDKNRCEQVKNARENVMYPYPIRHIATGDDYNYYWFVRNIVSSDQRMVANKWVGVN